MDKEEVVGYSVSCPCTGSETRTTMKTVWEVLKAVLQDTDKSALSDPTPNLLRGSRRFLESSFATMMRNAIQANRAQVIPNCFLGSNCLLGEHVQCGLRSMHACLCVKIGEQPSILCTGACGCDLADYIPSRVYRSRGPI